MHARSSASTAAARSAVAGCSWSRLRRKDATSAHDAVPRDRHPGDLLQLAHDHEHGDPGHVPDEHGLGQQIGQEAQPGQPGDQAQPADDERQGGGQGGIARRVAGRERGDDDGGQEGGGRLRPDRHLPRGADERRRRRGPRTPPTAPRPAEARPPRRTPSPAGSGRPPPRSRPGRRGAAMPAGSAAAAADPERGARRRSPAGHCRSASPRTRPRHAVIMAAEGAAISR